MTARHPRVMVQAALDSKPFIHPQIWTDLSERATNIETGRGRPQELARVETGFANVTLTNNDGVLSPANPDGPYAGKLLPVKRFRIFSQIGNMIPNPGMDDGDPAVWEPWVKTDETLPEFWFGYGGGEAESFVPTVEYDGAVLSDGYPTIRIEGSGTAGIEMGVSIETTNMETGTFQLFQGVDHVLRFKWLVETPGPHAIMVYAEDVTQPETRVEIGSAYAIHDGVTFQEAVIQWNNPSDDLGAEEVFGEPRGIRFMFGTDTMETTFWLATPQLEHGFEPTEFTTDPLASFGIFSGFVERWKSVQNGMAGEALVEAKDVFRNLALAPLKSSWYEEVIDADGPLHWYKLDDEPRVPLSVARDSSGEEDAAYEGQIEPVDGPFYIQVERGATQFQNSDQTYGGYVRLEAASVPTTSEWTFECWLNQFSSDDTGEQTHIQGAAFGAKAFYLEADGTSTRIVFYNSGVETSVAVAGSADWATDKSWHHVIIRARVSGSDRYGEVWADGVLQGTVADLDTFTALTSQIYYLGRSFNGTTQAAMCQVSWWDRALTDAECENHYVQGATPGTGDIAGERIQSILDLIDFPDEDALVTAGDDPLQPQTLGESLLVQIQRASEADMGVVYADAYGVIQNRSRRVLVVGADPSLTPLELTDDANDPDALRFVSPAFNYDDKIINIVERAKVGGSVVTVRDEESIENYGERKNTINDLILRDQVDVRAQAEYVLFRYKDPVIRLDAITLKPNSDYTTAVEVLSRDLFDPVLLHARPPGFTTRVDFPTCIGFIKHMINRQSWRVDMLLAPMDENPYLTLDDPVLGTLDSNYLGY